VKLPEHRRVPLTLLLTAFGVSFGLEGCLSVDEDQRADTNIPPANIVSASERECLIRAMYFESNRTSDEGLLAVGSTVMNRLKSGFYSNTICGVVGQKGQYAAGVLDKPMNPPEKVHAEKVADEILSGKRHPKIANAMHFHQAGLHFHFPDMHYVLVAGGNSFYEKVRRPRTRQQSAMAPSAEAQCGQTATGCATNAEQSLPK
jgi:spore germination cell wall hydrolase CwlJ-like protein